MPKLKDEIATSTCTISQSATEKAEGRGKYSTIFSISTNP